MATMPAKGPRRLPTLTIAPAARAVRSELILSPETPDEYHTPLSSTSTGVSFAGLLDPDENMAQDLAILEKLRRNVHMNLQLRPISTNDGPEPSPNDSPSVYSPSPTSPYISIYPESLARRLSASRHPLLIDTRSGGSYLASRLIGSVNIAIPSLILKRHRKPGANFPSIHSLRPHITTERGKQIWDDILRPDGAWDGDVVIYDEEMDEHERESSTAWILLGLLDPILRSSGGTAMFLHGGITAFRRLPDSHVRVVSGERDLSTSPSPVAFINSPPSKRGLSLLNIKDAQSHNPHLPAIEPPSASPPPMNSPTPNARSLKPETLLPTSLLDPSPPPSALLHRASQPNIYAQPQSVRPRKPSVPNLRRLDTTSAERLPKLTLRTQPPISVPPRAATLAIPSAGSSSHRQPPRTPPHLTLRHEPLSSASDSPGAEDDQFFTPATAFFASSPGPSTPRPHSPMTARPPPTTPTSEIPSFSISCILPNFLYLGPELTTTDNVQELQALGVKRILNLAVECDPEDHGLDLRGNFERYVKIPMRDTVEEENIGRGVREVCECLDDARLHSSPTYVHCKAGKSRSVTAVMAYLIHANHWTLSRAYSFVLERRKGISPNIGFVSELMNFEEQELGGKSVGVVKNMDDDENGNEARGPNYAHVAGIRRPAYMRESLPPAFVSVGSAEAIGMGGSEKFSGDEVARVGDHAQELEVKDSSGRYRHQRRAPVDENTLQPLRRVSKAGLESGGWT
ncbi:hypothetical protein M422DRAFT_28973 [Sphaerobolus stellatus SS14]|nr:hypothetical protein M422DRAFT_28973 [Sphaerobolus stellatus SS14]